MSKEFIVKMVEQTIIEYEYTLGHIYLNENNGKYYYKLDGCCCINHYKLREFDGPFDTYVQAQASMNSHYEMDYIPF